MYVAMRLGNFMGYLKRRRSRFIMCCLLFICRLEFDSKILRNVTRKKQINKQKKATSNGQIKSHGH